MIGRESVRVELNCFPSSLVDTTCFILGDVIVAMFTRRYLKCMHSLLRNNRY